MMLEAGYFGQGRRKRAFLALPSQEGELDTVTANAENITLRVRRGGQSLLSVSGEEGGRER